MSLPNKINHRKPIDPKLAVGSSLPNPKGLFSILFLLYIINDEKDSLKYSESVGNIIEIKARLINKLKAFLSGIPGYDPSKIEEITKTSPLVSMQIEPLQVSLEIYWKIAKINIIDTSSSSKERTGSNRYPKALSFTIYLDLLKSVLTNENGDISNKGKSLLYSWLLGESVLENCLKLEEKLKKTLLIFTEDTLFKTWETQSREIIFQQEGIYENLNSQTDTVNIRGAREIKGTLRNLNSILSKNVHPYLNSSSTNVGIINLPLFSEFDSYKKRVSNYLDLLPKSVSINRVEYPIEEEGNSTENIGLNTIYYGAPGTGKSYTVKEKFTKHLPEVRFDRITFHPEYDYASFVGGYKPIMEFEETSQQEVIKYKFVPQSFTNIYKKAWDAKSKGETLSYYLVIEEINRGNCAEIFGDIFQLLDRDSNYSISPPKELKDYLRANLTDTEYGLKDGKMELPDNLHIIATMNTSDQSLFPMDSAFKRRWDWVYMPINYSIEESNKSSKFKVQLSEDATFSWLVFIDKVNNNWIKPNPNLGMDKCIGNYFIKPKAEVIELNTFINKAIFYLWNDVFKDEMENDSIFKGKGTTYEDFFPINTNGYSKVLEILDILEIEPDKTSEKE